MEQLLYAGQIIVSVLIVITILMQNRGSGLSAVFGGGGNVYRTKRGVERGIYIATIVLVILFVLLGIANLIISS